MKKGKSKLRIIEVYKKCIDFSLNNQNSVLYEKMIDEFYF